MKSSETGFPVQILWQRCVVVESKWGLLGLREGFWCSYIVCEWKSGVLGRRCVKNRVAIEVRLMRECSGQRRGQAKPCDTQNDFCTFFGSHLSFFGMFECAQDWKFKLPVSPRINDFLKKNESSLRFEFKTAEKTIAHHSIFTASVGAVSIVWGE